MSGSAVIGIGNLLLSDDGAGIHAVRFLQDKLPPGVTLVEGGVYGLDLLPYLEGRDKVIFIDALDAGENPGALFRFTPRDVKPEQSTPAVSVHDLGLYELIGAAQLLDQCPEDIIIIAVQVKSLETGMELSPEVREALPHIHRLVLEEIGE